MKVLKKPIMLALVIALAVAFSALASAENGALNNSAKLTAVSDATIDGTSFTVSLTNVENGAPRVNTTFTYALSGNSSVTFDTEQPPQPEAANATVTRDSATSLSIAFDSTQSGANAEAVVLLAFGTFSETPTTADDGLRYYTATLTQTISGEGFANEDATDGVTTYTLFVYVNDNLAPYAAILSSASDWNNVDKDSNKKEGFTNTYSGGSTKVTIKKEVVDQIGNGSGEFQFSVQITLPTGVNVSDWSFQIAKTNESGATATATASPDFPASVDKDDFEGRVATITGFLAHNQKIEISDIPSGTVVEVRETDAKGYTITSAVTDMDAKSEISEGIAEDTSYTTKGTVQFGADNGIITYTNTREAISPTGVALRFAPYLFMLGAGVTLPVMSRRRKEEEF